MNKKVLNHFKNVDPVMYEAASKRKVKLSPSLSSERYFERLCRAIVGQQLSTKAASTIWGRFEELLAGKTRPAEVLKIKHEELRGVGLSNAKAKYVLSMAESVVSGDVTIDQLEDLSNEEVVEKLTKLKGVGRWTAEMFLMFTLGREDVFSVGDLGLRRAIEKLYGIVDPKEDELLELSNKWSPYRTYACRVLWETLDNNPDI